MELKQLTALVTVADVGSVTRAARILHIVQPAVTRQIQLLEKEFGLPLFVRTRQGMVPTEAGAQLVARARRVLEELERARLEIGTQERALTGVVTIGILESAINLVVDPLIDRIERSYPGIQVRVLTAYSGYLQQWLDAGDLDMSLLYNLSDSSSLAVTPLLKEDLWVVTPPGSGLRPDTPVRLRNVLAESFVLPAPGHGLRVLIEQGLAELGASVRISVETNTMHLQKRLVLSGAGWTILPAVGIVDDMKAGLLCGAPLIEPSVSRTVALGLQRSQRRRTAAVEAVATALVSVVHDRVEQERWPARDRYC